MVANCTLVATNCTNILSWPYNFHHMERRREVTIELVITTKFFTNVTHTLLAYWNLKMLREGVEKRSWGGWIDPQWQLAKNNRLYLISLFDEHYYIDEQLHWWILIYLLLKHLMYWYYSCWASTIQFAKCALIRKKFLQIDRWLVHVLVQHQQLNSKKYNAKNYTVHF